MFKQLFIAILIFLPIFNNAFATQLWQGIVAEDTSGDYYSYLCIASCVRNRILKSLDYGLVALKRKDLTEFVAQEYLYALKTKGIDLQQVATKAILEVFTKNRDLVNGATYFEHTKMYEIPNYVRRKNLVLVKVIYKGNKHKEISFWKER